MLSPYSTAFIDNSLKRKAETSDAKLSSPPPPNKLARLELNNNGEDLTEDLNKQFDSFIYWKLPLPDIESELNKIVCHMICD